MRVSQRTKDESGNEELIILRIHEKTNGGNTHSTFVLTNTQRHSPGRCSATVVGAVSCHGSRADYHEASALARAKNGDNRDDEKLSARSLPASSAMRADLHGGIPVNHSSPEGRTRSPSSWQSASSKMGSPASEPCSMSTESVEQGDIGAGFWSVAVVADSNVRMMAGLVGLGACGSSRRRTAGIWTRLLLVQPDNLVQRLR